MLRTALALCLLLGVTAGSPRALQSEPGAMPPVVLKDLTATPAQGFEDFAGRAVILEFFAEWCGPCGRSVPHMNELQERFGARGLSVVGVTSDDNDVPRTEAWVKRFEARYAWGWDPGGRLMATLGIRSIPHSLLLDPDGRLVWRGHPAALTDEMVEFALAGALPLPTWEWPEAARPAARLLGEEGLAAALAEARRVGAEPVVEALESMVRTRLASLRSALEGGDYLGLVEGLDRAERALRGLPRAAELDELRRAVDDDPAAQRVLEGQRLLRSLLAELGQVRDATEAEALLGRLRRASETFAGTIVAARAKPWIEHLEERLK